VERFLDVFRPVERFRLFFDWLEVFLERLLELFLDFLLVLRFADFFFGTFPPLRRASERPIAIACFRFFTFLPERPLLSFPDLYSCIARLTLRFDVLPYFAMIRSPVTHG
jgi:hypothetical protein